MSAQTARIIRVFVSSPSDVKKERDVLSEIVDSINRTDGPAGGFRLELSRWEDDVVPQIGPKPQQVVDGQTTAYDIYLGIMSTRFGTPAGRYGSGTEKEFKDAVKNWTTAGAPWITFYFDDQPTLSSNPADVEQYLKVCQFRQRMQKQGLYGTYKGVRGSSEGLFEKVSEHLRKTVRLLLSVPDKPGEPKITDKPPVATVSQQYTAWLLARCGELELMGLEIKHGQGLRLNHVYTPLATSARPEDAEKRGREPANALRDHERESKQLLLASLNEQSLYVSGDAGSGKSTFCRWITWLTCNGRMPEVDVPAPQEYQEVFPQNLRGRLPVLVRLRDFWQHLPPEGVRSIGPRGLEQSLKNWLAEQEFPGLDWLCLSAHLQQGSALLMLDGMDEVPPVRRVDGQEWYPREMLLAGLEEAVRRWTEAGNRVLLTSRPYGLTTAQQQNLGLPHAPIAGLDRELQMLLIRRWFVRLKETRDLGLETADAMIDHVHRERGLDDLAANPLLLTAMCVIYDEGKRLPHDKYLLYDRIVDTVLHKRYAERERIDPIRGRLAAVAHGMHTGEGLHQVRASPEASASDHEIDLVLQAYQQLDGSTDKGLTDTVRVREDLLSQSGLLVNRGDGGASFYHLSLQEFLAAERLFLLHGRNQKDFLQLFLTRGTAPGWRNTLSFLFGCTVAKFSANTGVEHLKEMAAHTELPPVEAARRGQEAGIWNLAIVLGDCLEILSGRDTGIPKELTSFFHDCVFRAIEQEIAVTARNTLAVALGRLGDPRISVDLRTHGNPAAHAGYVKIPAGPYFYGDKKVPYTLDEPFWLSTYPVTNSQYEVFIKDGGYTRKEFWSDEGWRWREKEGVAAPQYWPNPNFNGPNQPVVTVSWWEAEAFAAWAGGFLPTERQWEAAARGATGYVYPWGDEWEDGICNSHESGLDGTSAVGIFPHDQAGRDGVMDMAGNVFEWCVDPREPGSAVRVFRGGCWRLGAEYCRAAYRFWFEPVIRNDYLGFRVAAVPQVAQVPRAEPGT